MKRKVFLIIFIGVIAILVWRFYSSGSAKKVDSNTEQITDSPLDHEQEQITAHVPVPERHVPESPLDDDNSDNHMNYTDNASHSRYTNILQRVKRQHQQRLPPQKEPVETLV